MALAHAHPALAVPAASGSWLIIRLSGVVALCAAGGWLFYAPEATGDHGAAALVVFVAAILSSVAGFAFSALAGALIFHIAQTGVEAIQIMLVASIAIQAYSVWWMRRSIVARNLMPYLAGGLATIPAGVLLLLHTPWWLHAVGLGVFLMLYGGYVLLRPPWRLKRNSLTGQVMSGHSAVSREPRRHFPERSSPFGVGAMVGRKTSSGPSTSLTSSSCRWLFWLSSQLSRHPPPFIRNC